MQRSLLFNVSTSLEDQDVTGERQETAHLSEGHISAELQLRNECETLWQELNNVRSRLLPINLFEKYIFFLPGYFFLTIFMWFVGPDANFGAKFACFQ